MSAPDSSPAVAADASPKEVFDQLDPRPAEAWPALRRRLASLLQEGVEARDFFARLAFVEQGLEQVLAGQEDDSLFVLVQMLSDKDYGYSATHALTAAVLCRLVAPPAQIGESDTTSLVRAALTMNMAMTALQDELAQQLHAITETQRQLIQEHPSAGADMLQQLGVTDPLWLALVGDHHEALDGSGYPAGKSALGPAQQLLHMADVFIARISPRATRRGLWPNVAVSGLYRESMEHASPLGSIFAKQLGMYPPGTYVRLKSEETAVVVRRGDRVNTPVTLAITDPDGLAVSTPRRRDTQDPSFAVVKPVSPEDVKIRLNKARLLKRI